MSHCQAQQTSPYAPLSDSKYRPVAHRLTANLALCPTVRHTKPRCTPHYQAQQTSPCASLSGTANLALCPTGRHNKPRRVPHCQPCKPGPTPYCQAANLCLCPTFRQQISPCVRLSDNKLRPTVRHSKPRPVPHCQTQLT